MAKFNVTKAKAAGMSDEQINAYLAQNPQLERKEDDGMTGNLGTDLKANLGRIAGETIQEAAPFVREKTKQVLDKVGLPETGNTRSTAMNVLAGTPRTLAEIPAELLAENVTPTGLAMNALTLGAGTVAKPLLKGTSQVAGKLLSGKKMETVGRLFEDPGALVAGVTEHITKGAQKAFGAAKRASNIRNIKPVEEALESGLPVVKENVKAIREGRMARRAIRKLQGDIDKTNEVLKSGAPVPTTPAARQAVENATRKVQNAEQRIAQLKPKAEKIGERALEGRQALDDVMNPTGAKPNKEFNQQRVRKYLNKVLDTEAPAVRAADAGVSRAKLGQEFLSLLPEGFSRRVIATAGLGGSVFNPALIAPTLAFSPLATGVGTAAAGAASKGVTGLTKTALRRALISAMASRANKEESDEQE